MTPTEQCKNAILELQQKLLSAHPTMPLLLKQIHTQLKADPEIVTLLDESDIHILVLGLERQTGIELATAVSKSKTKPAKSISLDDL